jgi:hypothetical protein
MLGASGARGCGRIGIVASSVVCTAAVQRIEVITGAGGRCTSSADEKIRLMWGRASLDLLAPLGFGGRITLREHDLEIRSALVHRECG